MSKTQDSTSDDTPSELEQYVNQHRERLEQRAEEDDELGPVFDRMLKAADEGVL